MNDSAVYINSKVLIAELYNDYNTDKELTVFTSIDLEQFYETR